MKKISILAIAFFVAITGVLSAQQSSTTKPKQSKNPAGRSAASPTPKKSASAAASPKKENPNVPFGADNQNKGPTEITARDEFQFDNASRTGVFVGNVKVVDPDFTMTADKLTVHMAKQEEGGGLSSAEADGNVIIVHANQNKSPKGDSSASASSAPTPTATPKLTSLATDPPQAVPSPTALVLSIGRAQKALYDAKDQSMTLIGWPQVTQGVNTHISTEEGTRMILYRDGRLKTFGGSRTIIQDKSEANKTAPPK